MLEKKHKVIIGKLIVFISFFGLMNVSAQTYVNDMDYVIGDCKQAFIQNKITTTAKADNLLLGFKNMGVNGIRIPIFADGVNPNKPMFDYFYAQAVAQGFPIFANPAQGGGGARVANGMLNGDVPSVNGNADATLALMTRVYQFASEYQCKWINPFNEDGRATSSTWTVDQINTVYSRLYNQLNGAELVGPCTWGLPAGIDMLKNTDVADYITVATTHNLGFHHVQWPTFINLAKADNLPVWDSEVNHNDLKGTGTRLEKAIEYGVDGLVLYNVWNTVNLTTGAINDSAKTMMSLYLESLSVENYDDSNVVIYPNPVLDILTINNSNSEFEEYVIYNINGQVVLRSEVARKNNKIETDLSKFSKGVYLLHLKGPKYIKTLKFIKS